jgi:hypothetical protein
MADDATNVVSLFAPRPAKEPTLTFEGLQLDLATCALTMIVADANGDQHMISFKVAHVSKGFDLAQLVRAWPVWKAIVERAS